ncbi:MAP/microtubule affinity-regulating kinase 3a isoform X5 [Neoarius graeffei]|uniref:MAP/microtubule affinity-regulating kinase 3a isoform X5 n=1 Tax=Neoarius graeffei TaxID=443677 RepID=UPI00298C9446|nr:MAP/microtubule affinity-regulating kinase 3a isoform X5 [Neoarius graeffei]
MSTKTALPSVNERKTENHTSNGHSRMEGASRSVRSGGRNRNSGSEDQNPHIGNYRLLKTIGKGNFAKVKLGRHILTGREVAVKIIDRTQLNPTSLQKDNDPRHMSKSTHKWFAEHRLLPWPSQSPELKPH